MTITAAEMRTIAEEVFSKREMEKKEEALKYIEETLKYIEETVIPVIKEASGKGEFSTVCKIDDDVSIDLVMHELFEHGFRIARNNMHLRIMW